MPQQTNENFYDSAIRHWVDGGILEQQGEYDNAVCMQGFAAECALKAILQNGISNQPAANTIIRRYSHSGDILLQDLEMMLLNDIELTSVIDPCSGIRLSAFSLPPLLFNQHPERRYFSSDVYSEEDARVCRESAESCLKEMIRLHLDGYI